MDLDFQTAVVSMPTITSPILPLQGFSVGGWKHIMGMAIDMEFISINIILKTSYFAPVCVAEFCTAYVRSFASNYNFLYG